MATSKNITYSTYIPSQYRGFSEILREFLFQNPILVENSQQCLISMPETDGSIPGYPWSLTLALLEHQFSHFSFEVCDREVCMSVLPALAPGQNYTILTTPSSPQPLKSSLVQEAYGVVSSDFTVTLTPVDPSQSLNILPKAGFGTDFSKTPVTSLDSEMQNYLNHIGEQFGPKALSVDRFFSPRGLTSWYEILYQQKGFRQQLQLAQLAQPQILQPGAPSDIAPLQLNKAPRLSLEELQVDILSAPYNPVPQDNFSQTVMGPQSTSLAGASARQVSYFQSLSWSTLLSYAEQVAQENDLSPILINGIVIPSEIINLSHTTVDTWLSLFAETLARLVVFMNLPGGIFLVGTFFQTLSAVLLQSNFGSLFLKDVQAENPNWVPQCALMTQTCPTFPYLVHLAKLSS